MSGRNLKQNSRGAEFRAGLANWRHTPEASRPSLRALARELCSSHQLLGHYLKRWDQRLAKEYGRKAQAIRAQVSAENRLMTPWEEQQVDDYTKAQVGILANLALRGVMQRIEENANCGPLHPAEFKTVRILVQRRIPGAQKLLERCLQVGLKKRKRFADIVKETPQREGETYIAWVRRIWDECEKYDTNCPLSSLETNDRIT